MREFTEPNGQCKKDHLCILKSRRIKTKSNNGQNDTKQGTKITTISGQKRTAIWELMEDENYLKSGNEEQSNSGQRIRTAREKKSSYPSQGEAVPSVESHSATSARR